MPETLRFTYKTKPWLMIAVALFFSACAFFIFQRAIGNDRGLIINKVINLSADTATIFYYVMAVLALALALFGFLGLYKGLTQSQDVEISDTAISAPKGGFNKSIVSVPFSEITNLERTKIAGEEFINIHHNAGKLSILKQMCKNKDDFEKIINEVNSRVGS